MDARGNALFAIMLNAQRLHQDARVLLENGRYASAVALAVIAIEEVGKLLMLAEKPTSTNTTKHWHKRTRVAEEFQTDLWITASLEIVEKRIKAHGNRPFRVNTGEVDERLYAEFDTNERVRFIKRIRARGSDPKNDALYLDPRLNWSLPTKPEDISKVEALEWVSLAYAALQAGSPTIAEIVGDA